MLLKHSPHAVKVYHEILSALDEIYTQILNSKGTDIDIVRDGITKYSYDNHHID